MVEGHSNIYHILCLKLCLSNDKIIITAEIEKLMWLTYWNNSWRYVYIQWNGSICAVQKHDENVYLTNLRALEHLYIFLN